MTIDMDAVICMKCESELKALLENMSDSKGISLSAYCRFVLGVGLDELYRRNLGIRRLGKQVI